MKIYYITNARIPTEKAHGYQIGKMCEQFSNLGSEVELWVPNRKNPIKKDIFTFYNLKNNFRVKKIKSFDWFIFHFIIKSWAFKLQSLSFFISLIFKNPNRDSIIYTRVPEVAWLFKLKKYKVFFSAHRWPESRNKLFKFLLKKVDGIICNSNGTAQAFRQNNFKNILVAPNGVDLNKFKNPNSPADKQKSKIKNREELNLPVNKKIVMYVGHLYKWKGVDVVISVAEKLENVLFVLVGGTKVDEEKYKKIIAEKKLENVLLLGYQPSEFIPQYLKSADILILPNIPTTEESKYYTSPIKMFEYMASGTPIIASDLPSIKEVLNNNNAVLFKAGESNDLAKKIGLVLQNNELQGKISAQAIEDVKQYSWQTRAEKILDLL